MNRGIAKLMWMHSAMRLNVRLSAERWWQEDQPDPPQFRAASVYAGEAWHAYRPGEDERFPAKFVSRF